MHLSLYLSSTKLKIFFLIFFTALVLFIRIYNVNQTARFTRDESSDLARMHKYYHERKISFVGPISSENDKVFSSLSYYMVMPFAAIFDFKPIGPVYGTVFWGIITAFLLLLVIKKVNSKELLLAGVLIAIWPPLIIMSRWAWNPHYVLVWSALAFLSYFYRDKFKGWGLFFTGFFLSLLFHHHYVSIFATAPFVLLIAINELRQKKFKDVLFLSVGFILPFLVFVLFDLRHPPGLFFSRYLLGADTPHIEKSLSLSQILPSIFRNYSVIIQTIIFQRPLQYLLAIIIPVLLFFDLKSKNYKKIIWVIPVISTVLLSVILDDFLNRYAYSSLGFLFVWIFLPRKEKINNILANALIGLIILSSTISLWPLLHHNEVEPPLSIFTQATDIIEKTIKENQLNNANVAALASPDRAPLAEKYRDVIRMNGAGLREPAEYEVSEHLFVITTSNNEILRQDQSFAMIAFESAELKEVFNINSQWKVYWYGY